MPKIQIQEIIVSFIFFIFLDRPVQFFHFKNEFFINQQKLLFENLWDNSVPPKKKIIEMKKEVIDLILNPKDVVNIDELSKPILFRIIVLINL